MDVNKLAYPDYLLFKRRLHSFTSWPIQISQQKADLAHAGLFYSNVSDRVTCFACGVVLYGWKPWDDPWIEHNKHTRYCLYLKMVGGVRLFTSPRGRFNALATSSEGRQHVSSPSIHQLGLETFDTTKGEDEPDV